LYQATDMGCGASAGAKQPVVVEPPLCASQQDGKLKGAELIGLIRQVRVSNGTLTFQGRTRDCSVEQLAKIKTALDLLDVETLVGKWSKLEWSDIQESAATTLIMPSTMHQGGTTLCGAISVLEAMAFHRPTLYAKLVLAIWTRGQVVDAFGQPWGDSPHLQPELLDATPASSISDSSVADWMVATAMIAELKDQSTICAMMGHDDYLGQDAIGPDGKTVDFARGLTCAWDVQKFLRELLDCTSTERCMAYWFPRDSVTDRMIELTSSGALDRGELVVVCLISDALWKSSNIESKGWATPDHWVRVRSIVDSAGMLDVKIFSYGELQTKCISKAAWQRCYFEAVFGTLEQ